LFAQGELLFGHVELQLISNVSKTTFIFEKIFIFIVVVVVVPFVGSEKKFNSGGTEHSINHTLKSIVDQSRATLLSELGLNCFLV
jgi:hypothetical protein